MYKTCILCNRTAIDQSGNWSRRPGNITFTTLLKIRHMIYPNGKETIEKKEIPMCIQCFETKLEPWIKGEKTC